MSHNYIFDSVVSTVLSVIVGSSNNLISWYLEIVINDLLLSPESDRWKTGRRVSITAIQRRVFWRTVSSQRHC